MKYWLVLIILIILTFPAYKGLRHPGNISGHDSESAVFKSEEYFMAIKDGQFPPRWSKRLNYGLGQPTFTFTYQLPFWLTSGLMATGMSSVSAYKFVLAISFPAGAFFGYLWLRKRFGDATGVLAGLIYAYTPYQFANVYVRGAIGETVAGMFLPLSFYLIDRVLEKPNLRNTAYLAFGIAAVILSHQFYGLIFGLIWVGYWLVTAKTKSLYPVWGIALGYVMSSYYIIPAFWYKNLTFLDGIENYLTSNPVFATLNKLVYSPWGFAGAGENNNPMSLQLGFLNLLGLLGAIIFIKNKLVKFFWIMSAIAIFMMLPVSLNIWKYSGPFRAIQFPWRLLFVTRVTTTFCAAVVTNRIWQKYPKVRIWLFTGMVGIIFLISRNFWHVGVYRVWEDLTRGTLGYPGTMTLLKEETPKWHSIYDEYDQLHKYEFTKTEKGNFEVNSLIWNSNYHKLEVDSKLGGILSDKTHYWPGWKAFIDGKSVPLYSPTNPFSHGLLTMDVPKGPHIIETKLDEPIVNKIANLISSGGIGLAVWWMLRSKYDSKG